MSDDEEDILVSPMWSLVFCGINGALTQYIEFHQGAQYTFSRVRSQFDKTTES
jgi:hypothetical protein